jgi:putative aminopeptidase FrvX
MLDAPSKDLLRRLSLAPGAPGAEGAVRDIVRTEFAGAGKISFDRLGSILCEVRGSASSPRVLLDAHLDEVAFLVQCISAEGRLGIMPLGSWWGHVLLAQRVDVLASGGSAIPGVIGSKPPHFLGAEERDRVLDVEAMVVDVGASSREEAEALGIRVGDPVVPHGEFIEFAAPHIISSKAFDDRVGVGLLCETVRALRKQRHPNTVVAVGAVQEEVGCRGAATAGEVARADVALILEGAPADDLPGFAERQAVLGRGPQLRFADPTAISNRRLLGFVEETARANGIPVQCAVRRSGGTDAKSVHLHGVGVPTVVIGVPARYIHTHVTLIHWLDYVLARDLVLASVAALDRKTVAEFTRFDG